MIVVLRLMLLMGLFVISGCALTITDGLTGEVTTYDPLFFLNSDNSHISYEKPAKRKKPALPSEPLLRREIGMHTDTIRRLDLDRKGEWLVTASDDKTVRLWNLKRLDIQTPVRVYRVPSDAASDGKLYAVAISPDARLIATGGVTRLGSKDGYTIYIFDRATGTMIHRIQELPASILHLAFSPDEIGRAHV